MLLQVVGITRKFWAHLEPKFDENSNILKKFWELGSDFLKFRRRIGATFDQTSKKFDTSKKNLRKVFKHLAIVRLKIFEKCREYF